MRNGRPLSKAKSPLEGRVLRAKTGYNPNSSSVGSHIPAFLAWAAGASAFTVVLLQALGALGRIIRRKGVKRSEGERE